MDAVPVRSSDNEIRFTRKEIYLMVKDHLNSGLSVIIQHSRISTFVIQQLFEKAGSNPICHETDGGESYY